MWSMKLQATLRVAAVLILSLVILTGCSDVLSDKKAAARSIVTSDSILATMAVSLMPSRSYSVVSILPSGQCPGHYDVKLPDVERIKRADLVISLKGMPFMQKVIGRDDRMHIVMDTQGRNWMSPDAYMVGLGLLADRLAECFPEDKETIMKRKDAAVREVKHDADAFARSITDAGLNGKPVIAAALQKESLEWMGFRVVGDYGRPESLSVKQMARLIGTGKEEHVILVADNLQSGPDAGRGIAESLGVPRVVLTNFPSEKGYLATLRENVETVLHALDAKKKGVVHGTAR